MCDCESALNLIQNLVSCRLFCLVPFYEKGKHFYAYLSLFQLFSSDYVMGKRGTKGLFREEVGTAKLLGPQEQTCLLMREKGLARRVFFCYVDKRQAMFASIQALQCASHINICVFLSWGVVGLMDCSILTDMKA